VSIATAVEPPSTEVALNESLLNEVVRGSRFRPKNLWWAAAAAALVVIGVVLWAIRPYPQEPDVATVFEPQATTPTPDARSRPTPPVAMVAPARVAEPRTEPVAPASEPKPEVPPAEPKTRPEPPKVEPDVALPKPAPPPPVPADTPAPARRPSGPTEADLSRIFASIFLLDPSGDLWLRREGNEPTRVGRLEQIGHKDSISAQDAAGAFALEGKATVALEKGASISLAWKKLDQAYALSLSQGSVLVDTEGTVQRWQVTHGPIDLAITAVNGRFVVEPRGEQLAAVMIAGRGELRAGSASRRLDAGREVLFSPDQKAVEKPVETKKFARLAELRPSFLTVFSATFEEKDDARPFLYSVPTGRLVNDGTRVYLHAETLSSVSPRPGEKVLASGSVKPDRPILASDRLVLSFWYRTNQPTFTIRLGKYSAVYTSRLKPMEWGEGRIQLAAFENEGVTILPTDELGDIQFQVPVDGRKVATLDVDGVQFLRRAK
jgi:hypothetical protein